MRRLDDWPSRLMAWVRANERQPFAWGRWDCALAAAAAVQVLTGEDLAAEFRDRYTDAEGAWACLKAEGYEDLSAVATAKLGERYPGTYHARRGDLVLGETDYGSALLVCVGPVALGPGASGWQQVPMPRWLAAWRVG